MAFPSTFLDIQNAVAAKASMVLADDLQKIKDWINQTYYEVCVETEAIVTSATTNLTVGVGSYTLPPEVARIKQMFVTPAGGTTVLEQPPMELTTLEDIMSRRQTGGYTQQAGSYSTHYAVVGRTDFEVWPTPAAIDVITIYYAAFPTAMSGNAEVPSLDEPYASKLLEYGALVQAGEFKGDPSTEEWGRKYASWASRYANHLELKKGDRPAGPHQFGSLQDTQELYGGF